jgi:hypothetical protein
MPTLASRSATASTLPTLPVTLPATRATTPPRLQIAPPPAYLRVRLGPQEYGIAADAIHEVRAFEPPGAMRAVDAANATHAAGAGAPSASVSPSAGPGPACLLGVLNLRGRIVPIVDLRQLLGCPVARADAFTALVVLKHGSRWVGAVVDAIGEMAPGQAGLKEIDVLGLLSDPALALGA